MPPPGDMQPGRHGGDAECAAHGRCPADPNSTVFGSTASESTIRQTRMSGKRVRVLARTGTVRARPVPQNRPSGFPGGNTGNVVAGHQGISGVPLP